MTRIAYDISRTEAASRARAILERKITDGAKSAVNLIKHVHNSVPADSIVRARALGFDSGENGVSVSWDNGGEHTIHRHALSQMAAKAGIPGAYLSELAGGAEEWKRDLAAEILGRHFIVGQPTDRFLVRAMPDSGEVRGFLSDRYRRLDSRPLLDAFAESCQAVGAVPVDGTVSDTRVALKAMLPMVFEPVPGEVMAMGIEWGNSDFGAARHTARAFFLRVWCLNGAVGEDAFAQVHLGGRLAEDIEFSRRTYELDTKASVSALKDVVKGVLGPSKINAMLAGIKAADEKKVDWRHLRTKLARTLLKSELKAAEDAYNSEDVINLPAGKSLWRASNAVSWIARNTDDPDRRLELERVAGAVLSGKTEVAEAA